MLSSYIEGAYCMPFNYSYSLEQTLLIYNNKAYTWGTIVKFKKEFADTFVFNDGCGYFGPEHKLWKYGRFHHRFKKNGKMMYEFIQTNIYAKDGGVESPNKPYTWVLIEESQLAEAIEEIIHPVEVQGNYRIVTAEELKANPKLKKQLEYKKDTESEDVMMGWALFIAFLLFSLVFIQWPVAWILGGIGFYLWRKRELRKW